MDVKLPTLKKIDNIDLKTHRKKKKILLLSDDLRMSSGVGTMSREIVFGTVDRYDWVQIGGAIKHPEEGKIAVLDKDVREETGVFDASVKIYPISGYGNPDMIRLMFEKEKPDAIMIYTDPRFWVWLFQMEHEIRQHIPIMYYNIWDDLPYPMWNQPFYESCDLMMNISKQTVNIVKNVRKNKPVTETDNTYIPHGINEKYFFPIGEKDRVNQKNMSDLKNTILHGNDFPFIVLYNNRNIRRKLPGDVIMAYKKLADKVGHENVALIMHTAPVDDNGTDLPEVALNMIGKDANVYFSNQKLDNLGMNYLYNLADVTINIASNEGFGLATCESLMSGTPIVVNVTGGMQDQCGFKIDGKYLTADDYKEIGSLHDYRKWEDKVTHGEWVKPVWSRVQTMTGSVPTPYIIDDKVDVTEVSEAIRYWYDKGEKGRAKAGKAGRKAFLGEIGLGVDNQNKCMADGIEKAIKNFKPKKRYNLYKLA
mgnify:CR=1 FL=1